MQVNLATDPQLYPLIIDMLFSCKKTFGEPRDNVKEWQYISAADDVF